MPSQFPPALVIEKSIHSVAETMNRLEGFLKSKGVRIAARVDHSAAAKKADLTLRPTETLIFSNPSIGTHLMLAQQSMAIDLPLRIAVWEDEKGEVWLGYRHLITLTEEHAVNDRPELAEMLNAGLADAVFHATAAS